MNRHLRRQLLARQQRPRRRVRMNRSNYCALRPRPARGDCDEKTVSRWWDPPGELRGINLRSWLVIELHNSAEPLTVAELASRLDATGFTLAGRASKTISDALRWEVARNRARRLSRGVYAVGRVAKSTLHRMRRRITSCHHHTRQVVAEITDLFDETVVAAKRNQTNTPSPDTALEDLLVTTWPIGSAPNPTPP